MVEWKVLLMLCRNLHSKVRIYMWSKIRLSTVDVAFVAVFAALQAVLSFFPLSFTIGVSGEITMGLVGAALIGVLLGPAVGGLAVLIGSLIGVFLNPAGAIFGIFTIFPPFFGAVAAGCVKIKRGYVAGAIILVSLLVFYAHPFGREALLYPWLHIIAMIIAFSPIALAAGRTFDSPSFAKPIFGIALAAFIGVMTDHITGSALGIWYYSLPPEVWYGIAFVYPVERLVALTLATVIAVPLYSSLKRSKLLDIRKG